jgi:hypothetical protein
MPRAEGASTDSGEPAHGPAPEARPPTRAKPAHDPARAGGAASTVTFTATSLPDQDGPAPTRELLQIRLRLGSLSTPS